LTAAAVIKVDHDFNSAGWGHVLTAFGIHEVYELPALGVPLPGSIKIEALKDIKNFREAENIIVIQNKDGDLVQGRTDLAELEHPLEAIYVFGGSLARLNEFDVEGANVKDFVYIPIGSVFPHQAGAIVFWDRYLKRGGMA
jgi:hypothetical protein